MHFKVKVRTLDLEPLRENYLRSAQVWYMFSTGSRSFTCTPTRSSAIGMNHNCLSS